MKFWTFSTQTLATLLTVVSLASASGPTEGDATADPNSAVVKLTKATFEDYIKENPLVLAEFFAPWCGYCKILGPEYAKAADTLNVSHPTIKLAQIDCTEEEELCAEVGVKGFPSLKVYQGSNVEEYDGTREADGITDYMIKMTLPAVVIPIDEKELSEFVKSQTKPFIIEVKGTKDTNAIFESVAKANKKDYSFISVSDKAVVKALGKLLPNADLSAKTPSFFVVRPEALDDVSQFSGDFEEAVFNEYISKEVVPYFGEIDRDTYTLYMNSPVPIAYYFYETPEQREAVAEFFTDLGKTHRGKINFAALDATLYGRHAESVNMDSKVFPLFAIHNIFESKKYGVSQTEYPEGPDKEVMLEFVNDFLADKLVPHIKSEPLPTEEEIAASPVIKLVAHNHNDIVGDVSKDIFVKYYAPWCGHCKTLAPKWEELAEIFGSKNADSKVVIADIDHSNNDVKIPYEISGYPTLLLYPANGEVDEASGLRKPVVFEGPRDIEQLIAFVKEKGTHQVDGSTSNEAEIEADDEEEIVATEDLEHDEL